MPLDRRNFLSTAIAGAAVAATARAASARDESAAEPRLLKAVKIGMVREGDTLLEKFTLLKELGFDGLELDSPSQVDRDEALAARDATGLVIHGVVDSIHWNQRLSDPNPEIRAKGLAGLETALRDCAYYGGTTALLVPGKVADPEHENFDQVWERSTAEVRKAIPLADELGVKIAIEVVWNDFLTSPEQFVKYIDQFETPTVGGYFDISNMLKYGVPAATWIRQLGPRLLKFDFKGYSHERKWVAIGEGDEDWPEVLKALDEVGYRGWATAEVSGGGRAELADIAARMDKILGLG
jgi:hexulose-6-phosphate isomerase